MVKKTKPAKRSADQLMRMTALALIRDFQADYIDPSFCCNLAKSIKELDIAGMRQFDPELSEELSAPEYKARYQLASIFKRYRFKSDLYSDDELSQKAVASFLETQDRIRSIDWNSLDCNTQRVLNLARIYVRDILGPYNAEEHLKSCRFGRKASIGVPARKACLAERWQLPLTGSKAQIMWFDDSIRHEQQIQDYLTAQVIASPDGKDYLWYRDYYRVIDSLKLTLVPKTFKSLRAIMPNTTVGSYMSFGLGEMMRKRLKWAGYDLRTLQMRHRELARDASRTGLFVTADLSSASDSISVALVHRLFPSDWLEVLESSRIGNVMLPDDSLVASETYCTMGIGYTFPLQTLVFLSLLKAIETLNYLGRSRRTISVYGDDLIYHNRMHDQVLYHFGQLGFKINVEKTFAQGSFRESCGGDYFRGVDVRPFQPQNGPASVGNITYEAMLYKFINGLLMRFDEHEIGLTLQYLVGQVESVAGACKRVPFDYPDDAGIRCPSLSHWDFLQSANVAHPKYVGHGLYRFAYLRFQPERRKEERHGPYLWDALSGPHEPVFVYGSSSGFTEPDRPLVRLINDVTGVREGEGELMTIKSQPEQFFQHSITGERLRRTETCVTVSHTGRYTRQSGVSCFGTCR